MSRRYTVALCGNPNVGKSTVFNALTGMRQHTGNWAGKTVETARGSFSVAGCDVTLIDLPGMYSLSTGSTEERLAADALRAREIDLAVVVVDATCLERGLALAFQVQALAKRTLVCVNLLDEARKKCVSIDMPKLQSLTRLRCIGTCARDQIGLDALKKEIIRLCAHPAADHQPQDADAQERALNVCREAVRVKSDNPVNTRQLRLDRLLTGRMVGFPLMALLLVLVLYITMMTANVPSKLLSDALLGFQQTLEGWMAALGAPDWLIGALARGVYRTLAWVVSVMLPPMAIFFPLFTLLEDLGYLPRVAFNLDRCFLGCKACGKQALCMLQGLGCNAVGVTGARIIDSPRERLIAILTNTFMPCNGRFPTMIALLAIFCAGGAGSNLLSAVLLAGLIGLGAGMTLLCSFLLSKTLLKGVPSLFTLELPPFRRPQVGKVIVRSLLDRTLYVLGRAVRVAAPAGLILWVMANVTVAGATVLSHVTGFLDPLGRLLCMDGVILTAFLLGFPANEIVLPIILMGYLSTGTLIELDSLTALKDVLVSNGWTVWTAAGVLLFSLFHFPCSTTLLTIKKETGSIKWTVVAFLLPTVVGMAICLLLRLLQMLFGA